MGMSRVINYIENCSFMNRTKLIVKLLINQKHLPQQLVGMVGVIYHFKALSTPCCRLNERSENTKKLFTSKSLLVIFRCG